jgi:DNA-binding MarR family transcriptional regulator
MRESDFAALADFRYRLRRFLRTSEELARSHGMTPLQYQLLLQIRGFPSPRRPTVGDLAERLQAKHHGVVSLVSRCAKAGWVKRTRDAGDRRRVEVSLTREGRRKLDPLARLHRVEVASLRDALALCAPMPRARRAARARRQR